MLKILKNLEKSARDQLQSSGKALRNSSEPNVLMKDMR
jgi:hypothetical protein